MPHIEINAEQLAALMHHSHEKASLQAGFSFQLCDFHLLPQTVRELQIQTARLVLSELDVRVID